MLPWLEYAHIKDCRKGQKPRFVAGEGDGQVAQVLNALRDREDLFLSLEPHLSYAGPAGGFSGEENFRRAHGALVNILKEQELFEKEKPDVVLFDVLGDVVCGGFAAPIREGFADEVLIVTSGEKMALYAANNICTAVRNFQDRSYATVRGIILNRRNVPGEEEKVRAFATENNLPIVADIPRSDDINRFEDQGMTVIEGDPSLPVSQKFMDLADLLWKDRREEPIDQYDLGSF